MLADWIKVNLPLLSSVTFDTNEEVPMYLCPSYYDDEGELKDCKCGGCK